MISNWSPCNLPEFCGRKYNWVTGETEGLGFELWFYSWCLFPYYLIYEMFFTYCGPQLLTLTDLILPPAISAVIISCCYYTWLCHHFVFLAARWKDRWWKWDFFFFGWYEFQGDSLYYVYILVTFKADWVLSFSLNRTARRICVMQ